MGSKMTDEYVRVYNGQHGSYNRYPLGENDKILGGLAYIFGWIVSLIVLLAVKPLSPHLRFHAIQALGMHIALMILGSIAGFLSMFMVGLCLLPFVIGGWIYLLVIGILILTGGDHRIPWLGDYVEENYV